MGEILYCIEDENGNVIAKDMNMDTAMILARALFDNYYNEDDIAFTIKRQKEAEETLQYKKDEVLEVELKELFGEAFEDVLTYKTADKAKVGMKGYFADTPASLMTKVEADIQPSELTEILGDEFRTRFRNENGYVFELFFPFIGEFERVTRGDLKKNRCKCVNNDGIVTEQ